MHWVLQENIFNEAAWGKLIETLERFNISYSEHKVIPFIGELVPEPPPLKNVICFGSYSMRHTAKVNQWSPGVFDLFDSNFNEQMKHWGHLMLNADSIVCKFKDADWDSGDKFVRPIDDSKYFAGAVFDLEEFKTWQKNVCVLELDYGNSLTADTLIQVSTPKKIYAEYRCWVVDRKIVTVSMYKRGDKVIYQNVDDGTGDEVRRFATQVLKTSNCSTSITLSMGNDGWQPARAFCLDVCETPDGWKIVEINTINSCGFYAANITELVLILEHSFK